MTNSREARASREPREPGAKSGERDASSSGRPLSVLVVEDDPHILLGLEEILKSEGFAVAVCRRGDEAVAAVTRVRPAVIILDVMLPGASGYDVCRRLRTTQVATPILMLTAKGQEMDKVIGLELGADDYMTKPFGVRELVARVHALLRRARAVHGAAASTEPADAGSGKERLHRAGKSAPEADPLAPFQIGSSTIDPRRFELKRGRVTEELTARELKLLQVFHACAGEVLSRDRLLNEVWGHGYYGTTRTLDQVIVQLRRKLGDSGEQPRHLLTVHGVGYRLAAG